MMYIGEIISLGVAVSWTITALCAEVASKRLGSLQLNVIRMALSLCFLGLTLWIATGSPLPLYADRETWFWLSLSGFVGYLFGDWCLFNSYIVMGARFGQLFMTLAPIASAITAWTFLGETLTMKAILGMLVTCFGIGLSILSKDGDDNKLSLNIPFKGILLGIGAGTGQGVGLVLSKVGMTHYEQLVPAEAMESFSAFLPFASTLMRAVTGAVGFTLLLIIQKKVGTLKRFTQDKIGASNAVMATIAGPFVGVSFSLMAVLYTQAGIAQTLMSLTPIFILLPSYLIFHQKITIREIIGAVISVVGVSLFFI